MHSLKFFANLAKIYLVIKLMAFTIPVLVAADFILEFVWAYYFN